MMPQASFMRLHVIQLLDQAVDLALHLLWCCRLIVLRIVCIVSKCHLLFLSKCDAFPIRSKRKHIAHIGFLLYTIVKEVLL